MERRTENSNQATSRRLKSKEEREKPSSCSKEPEALSGLFHEMSRHKTAALGSYSRGRRHRRRSSDQQAEP